MRRSTPTILVALTTAAALALLLPSCGNDSATTTPDTGSPDVIQSDTGSQDVTLPPDPGQFVDLGPVPTVSILEPTRGLYASQCGSPYPLKLHVQSDAPLQTVEVQGQPLPAQSGPVDSSFVPAFGLNLIQASASTTSGAMGQDHRALLCGDYAPPSQSVLHAADMYLGKKALTEVGKAGAAWFDSLDLTAMFQEVNPLYSSTLMVVNAVLIDRSPGTIVELVPAWDRLMAHFEMFDLVATVGVDLVGNPGKFYEVEISASRVVMDGEIFLVLVDDGDIEGDLTDMVFGFEGLNVKIKGVADDLLALFPDIEETLVGLVEQWMTDILLDYVPAKAEDALSHVGDPIPVDLFDRTFELRFEPSEIKLKPAGIHLALDLVVSGLDPDPSLVSKGVLSTPGQEAWPEVEGYRLSLKDDFLNTVFHEVWRSGLLRFRLDQAFMDAHKLEMTLVAGFLGGVLDNLPQAIGPETPMAMDVDTTYPPVADLALPYSGGIRLGAGDVILHVLIPSISLTDPVMSLALTLRMDGEVVSTPSNDAEIVTHTFDVALDVINDDGTFSAAETYLEDTMSGLLGSLEPLLADLLGTIPLPSIGGFTLTKLHAGTSSLDGGLVVITGELVETTL